mmetsp:Transcript_43142/g.136361  ORF Transcript_43142/g.136361 Transcript_43142/m.136361 type:complete len:111 (+) Transcript_43142:892-1224(+)
MPRSSSLSLSQCSQNRSINSLSQSIRSSLRARTKSFVQNPRLQDNIITREHQRDLEALINPNQEECEEANQISQSSSADNSTPEPKNSLKNETSEGEGTTVKFMFKFSKR